MNGTDSRLATLPTRDEVDRSRAQFWRSGGSNNRVDNVLKEQEALFEPTPTTKPGAQVPGV
jgi:hypothetical protein